MKASTIGLAVGLCASFIGAVGCATGGSAQWPGAVDMRSAAALPCDVVDTVEVSGTLAPPEATEIAQSAAAGDAINEVLAVMMTVPAAAAPRLRPGQWVELTARAVPGVAFLGRLAYVSPAGQADSRWVPVVAYVPNEEGHLKSGLSVKGHIRVAARTALAVPRAAVRNWDAAAGSARVVVIEGGTTRTRAVRTGLAGDGVVEVTQGLAEGELVATRLQVGWTSSQWAGRSDRAAR